MQSVLTANGMRVCDQYTIDKIGVPPEVLMERAACAIADKILAHISRTGKDPEKTRVLAVCGPGNNGGDGIACARILFLKGLPADIVLVGKREKFSREMQLQIRIAENLKIPVLETADMRNYDCLIDAVFGIGLSRDIQPSSAAYHAIRQMNESGAFIVSTDIPSGISADTGKVLGIAVRADVTVTMQYLKFGHVLYPGAEYTGCLEVADIGIVPCPDDGEKSGRKALCLEKADLSFIPKRPRDGHKGTFGRVLVVAGSGNMAGAAVFACRAAFRTGCGMVRLLTPEANRVIVQTALPEALLSTYRDAGEALSELKKALLWADVIACGPGLGQNDIAESLVKEILMTQEKPLVLDADGLNVLKGHTEWLKNYRGHLIITPHSGEMSRLMGLSAGAPGDSPVEAACRLSHENGISCLLKGAATIIAEPDGRIFINRSGSSGMATAGSGDVLTGIAAGLMALKCPANLTAALAAYIHGCAGEKAAEKTGEAGVMASDIIENIRLLSGVS